MRTVFLPLFPQAAVQSLERIIAIAVHITSVGAGRRLPSHCGIADVGGLSPLMSGFHKACSAGNSENA